MEDQKQILSFLDAAARGDISEVERLVAAGGEAVVHGCDEDGQVLSSDLPLETILYYVYPATHSTAMRGHAQLRARLHLVYRHHAPCYPDNTLNLPISIPF